MTSSTNQLVNDKLVHYFDSPTQLQQIFGLLGLEQQAKFKNFSMSITEPEDTFQTQSRNLQTGLLQVINHRGTNQSFLSK